MKEKIAIFPGTFAPIHEGHLHVLMKAAKLFDKVIVALAININKQNCDNLETRLGHVKQAISHLQLDNVEVLVWQDYIVNLARKYRAQYLIRGVRNADDFENELHNATVNKRLANEIETVVFFSDEAYQTISSTQVKKTIADYDEYFAKLATKKCK